VKDGRKQAFEMALDIIAEKKVRVDDMLTHKFRIEDYRNMIDVNMHKTTNQAIKTAVTFE
jgi:threonine dehydrogenase-like Zn-dependent dehydrogenase